MGGEHLMKTRGITALLIALMGLPPAWAQPQRVLSPASAEAFMNHVHRALLAYEAAREDIRVAEGNMAQQENLNLWSRILQSRDLMTAARASEEWQTVIDQSERISADVRTLLQRLAIQADASLVQVRANMQAFEELGSEEHVPTLVEDSREYVRYVEMLIDQRQYRLAIATANEGLVRIERTVVESKRSLANQGIAEIEDLIVQIINAGGDRRMQERYIALTEEFDELLAHWYNQELDATLSGIEELRPMAEQMLSELQPTQP
jgi:hypothetical protein